MFGIYPLVPAYGRDYKSKKAAQADFDANLDFRANNGQATNKADLRAMGKRGMISCRNADLTKHFLLSLNVDEENGIEL